MLYVNYIYIKKEKAPKTWECMEELESFSDDEMRKDQMMTK